MAYLSLQKKMAAAASKGRGAPKGCGSCSWSVCACIRRICNFLCFCVITYWYNLQNLCMHL